MVRESDFIVRQHFNVADKFFECKHCGDKFNGKPSVTRLRSHLLGERNKGISICEKVPKHVKVDIQVAYSNKRHRILESSSVNNEMSNPASTSLPPQDNHLVQEQATLQNEFHGVEQVILDFSNPEPMTKQPRTRQDISIPLLTSELVGESYKNKLDEIWSSLKKEDVFKIGIYGMGGAGKTELARHIHNKLLERSDYDFICWINVSPHFSIRKLQNKIANAISFELPNKDFEIIRAELSRRLFDKKFVIILDDLWRYISLHDLGMTDGSLNGCKLIITTRSLHLCHTMNCQINVLVPFQDQNESWHMFIKELGKEESLFGEIVTVAKDMVKECRGLPVMIKSMARSMRGVEDIEEWRNALEEMKSCKMNEPFVEVFRQLRRSYDNLKDQSLQHCFLYCALFDGTIKRELIEHLIVEGIIEGRGNRRAKRDRAYTLLNKLHKVCLLSCDAHYVAMHQLIKKMAFEIMKENLPFKFEFSKEIKYLFMEDNMRISLNVPSEAMNSSDYVAACPDVSTMLMRGHESLTSIEDSFFDRFQNLKVLSLSFSRIVKLPKSIDDLKSLKALFIRRCIELKHVPSLAKLQSLEVLDLSYCAVKKVPEGMDWLSNLKVLNLIESGIEELEAGILKRLSRLEFLAFNKPSKLGEEIAGLSKLESLIWWFSDIHEFDSFLSKTSSPSLDAYFIYVGQWILHDCKEPRHGRIELYNFEVEREYLFCLSSCPTLLERVEEVELFRLCNLRHIFGRETVCGVSPNTTPPQTSPFSNLQTFEIEGCDSIQNLFPFQLLSNLQNLQKLSVSICSAMEEIIAAPEQDITSANSLPNSIHQGFELSLPKLKTLYLGNLPKLTSICPSQINCKSLCEITIYYCENLRKIPISLPLPSLRVLKVTSETWWDSVTWGSSDQKDILKPYFWLVEKR